jgi:predicted PurR-regulated permease PerM
MIMILILATILLVIVAVIFFQSESNVNKMIQEMDKKYQLQTSAINDLDKAQLRFQRLSNKLDGELDFWMKRRTMLPVVPKNTRIKKIRGKRRKGRK